MSTAVQAFEQTHLEANGKYTIKLPIKKRSSTHFTRVCTCSAKCALNQSKRLHRMMRSHSLDIDGHFSMRSMWDRSSGVYPPGPVDLLTNRYIIDDTDWNWTFLIMTLQHDLSRFRLRCERTACRNSDRLSSPDRSLSNTSQTMPGGAWTNECCVKVESCQKWCHKIRKVQNVFANASSTPTVRICDKMWQRKCLEMWVPWKQHERFQTSDES